MADPEPGIQLERAQASAAPRIAAIVHANHRQADLLVGQFVAHLAQAGYDVHGLVQHRPDACGAGAVLIDVHDGTRYGLHQQLGVGSQSCSVDSSNVTAASVALRRALAARADLVVANRFGELETTGGGLSAEMLSLMAEEIPLLVIVGDIHLDAWRRFTGSMGAELPPERHALDAWFAAIASNSTQIQEGQDEAISI